jgi:hypothetical protein
MSVDMRGLPEPIFVLPMLLPMKTESLQAARVTEHAYFSLPSSIPKKENLTVPVALVRGFLYRGMILPPPGHLGVCILLPSMVP